MLHLTNGDCAVPPLRSAGIDGEILPWREILHDGPVPDLDPEALRAVRAEFLGDETQLRAQDERLAVAIGEREPVTLWFEADLFDVLLLLQILERLPVGTPGRLVLVGQERWRSAADVEPDELAALGHDAPAVDSDQLALA